jgi:hypothetical protein
VVLVKTHLVSLSPCLTGQGRLPITHSGVCGIIGFVADGNGSSDGLSALPTAPLAAAGLIAGFAVAVATGSRPLGGLVLAAFGIGCIAVWMRRDGPRITAALTICGLVAFAISHLLGRLIGAWPAVLIVAAGTAGLYWRVSDSKRRARLSWRVSDSKRRVRLSWRRV